jgi:hypothetical protein
MKKLLSPNYYLTDVARFFLLFALMMVSDDMVTYLSPPALQSHADDLAATRCQQFPCGVS